MELYDINMTDVVNYYIGEFVQSTGCTKAEAKKLFLNALMYNVVINEVTDMMVYLKGEAK